MQKGIDVIEKKYGKERGSWGPERGRGSGKASLIIITVFDDISECCIPPSVSDVSCSPAALALILSVVILQKWIQIKGRESIIPNVDYKIHTHI